METAVLLVLVVAGVVVGAALYPMMRGARAQGGRVEGGDVDEQVAAYRRALRAGTVCGACGRANPDDSKFCLECGARLSGAD